LSVRGYYRHPTIHGETIVFVSEDDLWSVDATGGVACRLTANPGRQSHPRFSPDGALLAFVSRDEGPAEVHVMPADGGPSHRLSFLGALTEVVGWDRDGGAVIVATDHAQPFAGWAHLWSVPVDGAPAVPLGLGPARALSRRASGRGVVIGRNSFDPARWKRYRGGRTGSIWIDRDGSGSFVELVRLPGNLADPMWLGRRVFFLSDHEGHGNLYSVTPAGRDLTRHTEHEDYYARFPSTDGSRIVYHCGSDLWLLEPAAGGPARLDVLIPSARPQLGRRFMAPSKYLESAALHPQGHSLALTARGQAFTLPLWEGAPARHGPPSRHRRRLAAWLSDGERVVMVTDEMGEEALTVERADGTGDPVRIERDLGRARSLDPAPAGPDRVAVTNHRHELLLVDLARRTSRVLHRSPYHWITGTSWSPDGRWLAFSAATTRTTRSVFLYDTRNRRMHTVGRPEFDDVLPAFDPDGRHLYFLSGRSFDPVADVHFHDYGFPLGYAPYLVTLQAGRPSPFDRAAQPPRPPGAPAAGNGSGEPQASGKAAAGATADTPAEVEIDVDGLAERVVPFPLPPARYAGIVPLKGRVVMLSFPVEGTLGAELFAEPGPRGRLEAWDFGSEKSEPVADGVSGALASTDGKVLGIRSGSRLRVVPAGWKDDKSGKEAPGRDTGWVDLDRVRLEVIPVEEWRQMFSEAWRLQRDHYWFEDMAGVDWLDVHDRYAALVDRLGSRSEFSDLLWEMQGELGTSHAYELGGDYRPVPSITHGFLGADLRLERGRWVVDRVPYGDSWVAVSRSPLAAPGVEVAAGDRIETVDGVAVGRDTSPAELLVDRGGRPVSLTVRRGRSRPRTVVVTALASETALRYRDWVESNRARVHDATGGRAGYLHIPDMGPSGFSEFHRAWHHEVDHEGLVVDVRFNRGGNVSQLLLQKLLRRRLGYRVTRWREPYPFPDDAPAGPMVCLTNENAGSDGDIFSHTFKLHGLGPLIGTRTWGGVVGIWPQQSLVDGTITTQPEFGTWFTDVGYAVENYGTDPDIEVIVTPQDYREGRDPQLERGITELLARIEAAPPLPEFGALPSMRPPRLPR
jgi:tricorn protease